MRLAMVLGLFLAFALGCSVTPSATMQSSAERNAAAYAAKMGMAIKGAACSGADSDRDGYVSCTLALGGLNETLKIECGYDQAGWNPGGPNTGCKEWTPKAPVIQQVEDK